MSASIWQPGGEVLVSSDSKVITEHFTITDTAQALFILTNFSYVVGTNSLAIYINGVLQRVNTDYVETSESSFTIVSHTFTVGDTVTAIGQIALTVSPTNPYGTSRDVQIATEGQTVFTISSPAYLANNGSLRVYINGLFQEPIDSYAEVSGTVTFSEGLRLGDEVTFLFNSEVGVGQEAAYVSYLPAGAGAVVTDVQSRLREAVSVKDFGAVGDGAADDTAAIQACIDANPARRIFFPKGVYKVSSTIWNKYDGTILEGESVGAYTFGQADDSYGTTLQWAGSAGGTVVKVARFESTSAPYSFSGGGIKNIRIDCLGTNTAGVGLYIPDANNCVFEHIKIDQASSKALDLTGYVPDVTGINSVYNCAFRDMMITVTGTGDGIYMGDTPNVGGGDHPAFVTFDNIHITYSSGIAINIYEADDTNFTNVGISRAAGGTGDAIVLQGSGTHGNHFRCLNVTNTDGTSPLIWVKSGVRATYFEIAGIDKNIRPTIDVGAEAFYLYLGSNNVAYDSEFRSPVIRLPNINKGEANYLDWYEEGTFTPTIAFGGASVGVTYGYQSGRYVRIGRTVFITCSFSLTSKGSSTGTATISGLPFTSSSSNSSYGSVRPVTGFTVGSVDNGIGLTVSGSLAVATLFKQTTGSGGMTAMTDADLTATAQLITTFNYEV